MQRLSFKHFNQDSIELAKCLLGKIIHVKYEQQWLQAMIIETEAYYLTDKASHASLGYTAKRKALFMQPGTIYMYYARGGPSFNISAQGFGNAVLIKSGYPYANTPQTLDTMIQTMQQLNPHPNPMKIRSLEKLCAGQTLLCKSLGLKVPQWDQKQFHIEKFFIADIGYQPQAIISTKRLGIPYGRDEDLMYRFIIQEMAHACTKPPIKFKPLS